MTPFEKLLILRRGGQVIRFHTQAQWVGPRQTVGQHTFGVLLILMEISPAEFLHTALIQAALYHDLAEQNIGDLPAPVKWRSKELATAFHCMEDGILLELRPGTRLSQGEKVLLNAADFLDLCFTALEQYFLGNQLEALVLFKRLEQRQQQSSPASITPTALEIYSELQRIWHVCQQQSGVLQSVEAVVARQQDSAMDTI